MDLSPAKMLAQFFLAFYFGTFFDIVHCKQIHRHGTRAPISTYPTDPYKNVSYWPEGWGELTQLGKEQMYKIGLFLADRYRGFLGSSPREVYARSSASPRCLESISLILAGFYPPTDRWKWNSKLGQHWQPFPINMIDSDNDGLLNMLSNCPLATQEMTKIIFSSQIQQFENEMQSFFYYIRTKTGTPENIHLIQASIIFDTLKSERDNNLTLPSWVTSTVYRELFKTHQMGFYMYGNSFLIQRLRAGLLLKEITNRIDNPGDKRVYIFSTHDLELSVFLQAIDAYNNIPPPYGATILLEVHENETANKSIQAFYLNTTSGGSPFPLALRRCATVSHLGCDVDRFKTSVQPWANITDWNQECQLSRSRTS